MMEEAELMQSLEFERNAKKAYEHKMNITKGLVIISLLILLIVAGAGIIHLFSRPGPPSIPGQEMEELMSLLIGSEWKLDPLCKGLTLAEISDVRIESIEIPRQSPDGELDAYIRTERIDFVGTITKGEENLKMHACGVDLDCWYSVSKDGKNEAFTIKGAEEKLFFVR